MRYKYVLVGMSSFVGTLLHGRDAYAWFEICNKTAEVAEVAFAYLEVNDNRNRVLHNYGWMVEGWKILSPGQCVTVYPHELWRRNRHYYYYAQTPSGRWTGDSPFCVSKNAMQPLPQIEEVKKQCRSGSVQYMDQPSSGGCRGPESCLAVLPPPITVRYEKTYWLNFRHIDIGGGERQNWTENLVSSK